MEMDEMISEMEKRFKPYSNTSNGYATIPGEGIPRERILKEMESIIRGENEVWKTGHVSGAVYNGYKEHVDFTNEAYSIASQNNPLHPDVWPSSIKFESEIISMVRNMMHGDSQVRGSVTSGGTESILLAVKTYRDWARDRKGITEPEIVLPKSAHAAFDKASHYFGIKPVWTRLGDDFAADPGDIERNINENTIAVVGSSPCFPYGVIDPIGEIAEIAASREIGMHVDACLGGFLLPWAKKLGRDIPDFDFSVPGVTSMSVDSHKYGYAPKGTSTVLYRDSELIQYQYYVTGSWSGGIYFSPTMSGSRSGGVIAATWAALLEQGESGYMAATRKILEATDRIREGVLKIPGLKVMGKSPFVVAFTSDEFNIYQLMERMSSRSWILNGLHRPPGVHIALTLRHTEPGVPDRFLADLEASVREVRENPEAESGMAPVYGMAATFPEDAVRDFMKSIVEWMYS